MITIKEVGPKHFPIINELAHAIWPSTFCEILSNEQIKYMLNMMYSIAALEDQHQKGHRFLLAYLQNKPVGYIGIEINYQNSNKTKIHKIYVLPTKQGNGIGLTLLNHIQKIALEHQNNTLTLNVNRYNKAINFYEKIGFIKVKTEDINIGNGFLMEDYVMEKPL